MLLINGMPSPLTGAPAGVNGFPSFGNRGAVSGEAGNEPGELCEVGELATHPDPQPPRDGAVEIGPPAVGGGAGCVEDRSGVRTRTGTFSPFSQFASVAK